MPGTLRHSLLLICLLALLAGSVLAQADACGVDRNVQVRALDELTWKQLNRVYEQVGDEEFDSAYDELQKMLRRAGKDEYLQAVLYQALAQVEWSRQNYDASLSYFEQAVQLDTLPDQTHFALMYQIAQLYYMNERYDESLDRLELWMCKVPPEKVTAEAYMLQASIYAQEEDWANVVKAVVGLAPAQTVGRAHYFTRATAPTGSL